MALTDVLARADHGILMDALLAIKGGYHESTLDDDITLDSTYPSIVGFDPDGSNRDVTLEGVASAAGDSANHGKLRLIVNKANGAENLVVKDAQTSPSTIATINQNEAGLFYHDEDDGWSLVCIFTIAIS